MRYQDLSVDSDLQEADLWPVHLTPHLCLWLACTRSSGPTDHFGHLCPIKGIKPSIRLPSQELETCACLTGPVLNHALGREEEGANQVKVGPLLSDPIRLPEFIFYHVLWNMIILFFWGFFQIKLILCALDLC